MKALFIFVVVFAQQKISQSDDFFSFLTTYGYFSTNNETLNLAIREAQRIAAIPITAVIDNQTLQLLQRRRCGLSDIDIVRLNHSEHRRMTNRFADRTHISYKIKNAPKSISQIEHIRRIAYDAASTWNRVLNLQITESFDEEVDVEIGFQDSFRPYILGNTLNEENTTFIYLSDHVNWTYYPSNDKEVNLRQTLVHQFGHVLGLHHSDHPDSVMYPYENSKFELHPYDIALVQRVHGPKKSISTTVGPSNLPIDPCNSAVDASEIIDSSIFMFRHDKFWRISLNGTLLSRPRLIREYFPELLRWPIDAVIEINGQVLIFIENQVLTFQNRRLQSTQNLTELGFPKDLTSVRLAYKWIYGNVGHFIWNDTHYWKLDINVMKPEVDYPRLISAIWKGIPSTVSTALTWSKDLYFIDAGEIYKFDSFKMNVARGFPRRFSHVFDYCAPKIES